MRIDGHRVSPRPASRPQPTAKPAATATPADTFEPTRSQPGDALATGSTPTVPQGDLQQGDSGAAVQQLQQDLVALGYLSQADMNTGPGAFGPHTLAAVKAFQSAHGVPNTGYFGSLTRAALESALGTSQPAPAPGPTPAAPSGTVPPMDLKQGDSGQSVEDLQNDLVHLGFMSQSDMNSGPGIFGPHTLAAVKAFQSAHGVPNTGYYGAMTRSALSAALNGTTPAQPQPAPSSGGNAAPTNVARQYLGKNIADLKGRSSLDLDTWPANNVCCANFVSACLEQAGELPAGQHNDNVTGLVNNLKSDGWTEIPLADAQPGDVVTFDGPEGAAQHVELFNAWVDGKPQYIGSNNINADGSQQISYDTGAWAYHVHVYRQA